MKPGIKFLGFLFQVVVVPLVEKLVELVGRKISGKSRPKPDRESETQS